MPDLDYTIKTTAELSGAESVSAALEKQIGQAKALGQDYSELQQKLDRVNESIRQSTAAQRELGTAGDNVVNVTKEDIKSMDEARESTSRLEVSKRELREMIRSLTQGFPILGEVARAALNPLVFVVAAPIAAFEIFKHRVEAATEALSDVEMPDLTKGIEQAKQLAEHWNGVAAAIAAANREFNSPEGIFKHQTGDVESKLGSDKQILATQKEKALANLGLGKGSMSDDEFKLHHAEIENFYTQKEFELEKKASADKLSLRYNERLTAGQQALQAEDEARKIKLPESKEEFQAQQDALKQKAETLGKTAEKAQAQLDFIGGINDKNLVSGQLDYYKFYDTYGRGQTLGGAQKIEQGRHNDALDQQRQTNEEIARREALFQRREELRSQAADAAGTFTRVNNELPGERKNWELGAQTASAVNAGTQQVNIDKVAEGITSGGRDIAKLLDAIHSTNEGVNGAIKNSLETILKQQAQMKSQISQLRYIGDHH